MALYITLIGCCWLLAAVSAVLWLRKHPGQPLGRRHPETQPGRSLTAIWVACVALGSYGGSALQTRYHWGWWVVPAVYVPLLLIGTATPILIRRSQLKRSAPHPEVLDSTAGVPPTV